MKNISYFLTSLPLILFFHAFSLHAEKPQVTIVLVVDQLAYHYISKLKQYLQFGIKDFLDNGIVYTNAIHPHGLPATATGHTALNTGTYAHYHGIVNNEWLNVNGQSIPADKDPSPDAAVFSPTGLYDYNKSACNIMVDGLSDQAMLSNDNEKTINVFSISLKSRAAIGMAGKLGKAVWFDSASRSFTSSKAYFNELPEWVTCYNKNSKIDTIQSITWKLRFPKNSPAYQFKYAQNYDFAGLEPRAGKKILTPKTTDQYKDPIETNPFGNQICLDLALQCIKNHIPKKSTDSILLWISLSCLDIVGHQFGPDCLETIDMVYHIDKQLQTFMKRITKHVGKNKVLFVLTADHGSEPIPEILAQKGIPSRRLPINAWISEINELISKKLSISSLITTQFYAPYFYFNESVFSQLDQPQKEVAYSLIKEFLMSKEGVKKVWSYQELEQASFENNALENYFKQQLYPGRSGQVIIQTDPYNQLNSYPKGTDHCTPYEANTHVPIIIYQHGTYEGKVIDQKVWTLQLANTLAHILEVPRPSASIFDPLPGIIEQTDGCLLPYRHYRTGSSQRVSSPTKCIKDTIN